MTELTPALRTGALPSGKNRRIVIVIAAIASTGGLLFGFDTGVISGAIPYFQSRFQIGNDWVELITTAGLLGAVIGALFCGRLADVIGRKKVILAAGFVFAVGALWSGMAGDARMLIAARFFLGSAIGVSSFAVPLYIAEISPARTRGVLVSLFQLLITIGIMVSYFSDSAFALPEGAPGYAECWRPMFYVGVIPALIMFIGMVFLPETPRWLLRSGREEECRSVLERVEDPAEIGDVIARMKEEIALEAGNRVRWSAVVQPWLRTPLIIAIGIMFVQQFTGINTIIYYSPKIFLMAGFEGARAAITASITVGVVNVAFCVVSLFLVDRIGRRKLYFTGVGGMVVALIALSSCFVLQAHLGNMVKPVTVALVWIYCACFSVSLGPLGWLIISEVFPLNVRGIGSSIGSLSCWRFNGVVAFTFFKIVRALTFPGTDIVIGGDNVGNPAGAFALYALVGLGGLVWGFFFIPETKGKSLEHIEEHWRGGKSPRQL